MGAGTLTGSLHLEQCLTGTKSFFLAPGQLHHGLPHWLFQSSRALGDTRLINAEINDFEQLALSSSPPSAHQRWVTRQEEGLVWWGVRGRHPGGSLAGYLPGTCVDPSWGGSAVSGGLPMGRFILPLRLDASPDKELSLPSPRLGGLLPGHTGAKGGFQRGARRDQQPWGVVSPSPGRKLRLQMVSRLLSV